MTKNFESFYFEARPMYRDILKLAIQMYPELVLMTLDRAENRWEVNLALFNGAHD